MKLLTKWSLRLVLVYLLLCSVAVAVRQLDAALTDQACTDSESSVDFVIRHGAQDWL